MSRIWVVIMIVFCGCGSAKEAEELEKIPLQFKNNILIVKMLVNGKPADFIIDTGATISLIDHRTGLDYGIKILDQTNQGTINGFGGKQMFTPISSPRLFLNNIELKRARFYATDLQLIRDKMVRFGVEPLGIIGSDFLHKNKAVINYSCRTIQLNQ